MNTKGQDISTLVRLHSLFVRYLNLVCILSHFAGLPFYSRKFMMYAGQWQKMIGIPTKVR